jgi:hypothetical protein
MTLLKIVAWTLLAIGVLDLLVGIWQQMTVSYIAGAMVLGNLFVLFLIRFFQVGHRESAIAGGHDVAPAEPKTHVAAQPSPTRPKRGWRRILSSTSNSLVGAALLFVWDSVVGGTYITSILVCPVWLLISVVKNIIQRPGWRIAFIRIATPALTLGIVLANNSLQWNIADAHAQQIIKACDVFYVANKRYPHTLDELVPRYLRSVPRAKYCLTWGEFMYWNFEGGEPFMVWYYVPPFGRKIYHFQERRWGYLD